MYYLARSHAHEQGWKHFYPLQKSCDWILCSDCWLLWWHAVIDWANMKLNTVHKKAPVARSSFCSSVCLRSPGSAPETAPAARDSAAPKLSHCRPAHRWQNAAHLDCKPHRSPTTRTQTSAFMTFVVTFRTISVFAVDESLSGYVSYLALMAADQPYTGAVGPVDVPQGPCCRTHNPHVHDIIKHCTDHGPIQQ